MEVSFANVLSRHVFVKIIFFCGPTMAGAKLYSHLAVTMRALNYILPVFFLGTTIFLWQKAKIGFHLTESNGSLFFLPLLVV